MKYCLLGEKLTHSYSKEIHNYCGLDYVLKEVSPCMVGDFAASDEFSGYNVTIPYKKTVMSYLDCISDDAKSVGAVNTVLIKDGVRYGYNTDVAGFLYTVRRKGVSLENKTVMILGTGGASNAVKYACVKENAKKVLIVGRTSEINYQNCYENQDVEVIINATPVGMSPDFEGCPINLSKFANLKAVFDLIYNPQKTALLLDAERLNIINSNGLPMLVEQALCAQDIWLSTTHDKSKTEEIIEKIARDKLNICLTGMPGSGKSTVGKLLAERLERELIDIDEQIFIETGKSPKDIINESGEVVFRDIETQVLKKVLLKSGAVISLGGGAIIKEQNRKLISQNAVSVYIKRDLSLLSCEGRPLSLKNGVEKLFNDRKSFYESADITVDNNGEIENTVKETVKLYETFSSQRSKS